MIPINALILTSVLASGLGQLFLKVGAQRTGDAIAADGLSLTGWLAVLGSPHVIVGVGLWVLSTVLYLLVLSRTDLSYAYCLGSLNYVVVPLVSRAVFGEVILPLHYAGIGLIAVGVGLTMLSRVSG
jgi:undecaprenyl phosphate-alpha-L-ara4N flippase subunit ArnE